MSNIEEKTLEEIYEQYDAISYSSSSGRFTITLLDDIDQMLELYRNNPVVREFVDREINGKKKYVHDIPEGNITGYEIAGFLWFHAGEEYTLDPETY